MHKDLTYIQNTPEWEEMRKHHIGASDAPIIMQVSPWTTPYQLWRQKLGLADNNRKTFSMQRGQDLESKARDRLVQTIGLELSSRVKFHPEYSWMMASLDGVDAEHTCIVEIKCPGPSDHKQAQEGHIPDKYVPQLQHQMEVCQLEKAYYYSFDGTDGILLEIERDDKYLSILVKKEKEFFDCMINLEPPKLLKKDFSESHDKIFIEKAMYYSALDQQIAELEKRKEELKKELIGRCGNQNMLVGPICFTRIERKGAVQYQSIPELQNVNLEPYRKPMMEYWKITSR